MNLLTIFVVMYMAVSVFIGVWASSKVKTTTDFVLAGRSLPIYVTIATVFATWFGSEAVLGIPATFIKNGLTGIIGDPFGAGMCLIFVGVFFAKRLYNMNILTIGDFFRKRYNPIIEKLVSLSICISYLGWLSAQIVALGLTINLVTQNAVSFEVSMVLGLGVVLFYTLFGGMWSVAITDFVQMLMIIIGLLIIAFMIANQYEGGAVGIIQHAHKNHKFEFWPELKLSSIITFVGAFITMAFGSIPQQDVFQRVMSAKNEKVAVRGTIIGGIFYMFFCFVPIFIVYGASLINPELSQIHNSENGDPQRLMPEYIMTNTPLYVQVMFFGALLSAIMSTASGTLLAPSVIFAENILKEKLQLNEKQLLVALRMSVLGFGLIVLAYAYLSQSAGLSIFEMVENAYLITLCGAFVPLTFGMYWKHANNTGALCSIIFGISVWILFEIYNHTISDTAIENQFLFPPQLAGLTTSIIGMIAGSLITKNKIS